MTKWISAMGVAALGLISAGAARAADQAADPWAAIKGGNLILEERVRVETVDQSGLAKRASAETARTRLGWRTQAYKGLVATVEFEDVRRLGPESYNIAVPGPGGLSLNGKHAYPIINDPQTTELNRAQLAWTPVQPLTLTLGRQRLIWDDQRFVGDSGWRQDEQTFDAGRADLKLGRLSVAYAYVGHVNRIYGERLDWSSRSHLLDASYTVATPLTVQGFVYALDFQNANSNSSLTTGGRLSGKLLAGALKLAYGVTSARETPYGDQPAHFDLGFTQGDLAANWRIWTVRADYEVLQGDGKHGFFTPLATTHLFQGWADAFAVAGGAKTRTDGIRDLNVSLSVKPPLETRILSNPELFVRWHEFNTDRTDVALGHELDLLAVAAITPKLSWTVKYAQFMRVDATPAGTPAPPASRTKVWTGFEFKL